MDVFVCGCIVGLIVGLGAAGLVGLVILNREITKNDHECRAKVSHAEFNTNRHFLENEELKEAISTAQQALAEVRPPRTEHKVNY